MEENNNQSEQMTNGQNQPKEAQEYKYVSLSDENARQLAVDILEGKVYTDRHDAGIEPFKGIMMLAGSPEFKKHVEDIKAGCIYEYLSRASPRSSNGLPIFLSFNLLDGNDTIKVWDYYHEFKEMKDKMLKGG